MSEYTPSKNDLIQLLKQNLSIEIVDEPVPHGANLVVQLKVCGEVISFSSIRLDLRGNEGLIRKVKLQPPLNR